MRAFAGERGGGNSAALPRSTVTGRYFRLRLHFFSDSRRVLYKCRITSATLLPRFRLTCFKHQPVRSLSLVDHSEPEYPHRYFLFSSACLINLLSDISMCAPPCKGSARLDNHRCRHAPASRAIPIGGDFPGHVGIVNCPEPSVCTRCGKRKRLIMAYLNGKLGRMRRAAPFFGIAPAILGLIVLIAPVDEAAACRPSIPTLDYKSTMKMIRASDAVFVGTVMSSSNHPTDHSNTHARIKVETVWKGKLAKQVTLYAARFSICRASYAKLFPKGTRYLVFATKKGGWVSGIVRPTRYRVIESSWSFHGAKAPAEVMRALKDDKAGS